MKTLLLLLALVDVCLGQNIMITAVGQGPTNTQAVFTYTAPDTAPCLISVTNEGGFVPDVYDVDGRLYAGVNEDLKRPDTQMSGGQRTIVIGHRTSATGQDRKLHSLALQANTPHTLKISCGGGRQNGTLRFKTANLLLGNTGPDTPPFNSDGWGNWGWPTVDYSDKQVAYVDPMSGLILKRVTGPGELGVNWATGLPIQAILDLSGGQWQQTQNIGSKPNGKEAQVSVQGSPAKSLFVLTTTEKERYFSYNDWNMIDDVRLHLVGHADAASAADRTLSACISPDFGQSCVGSPIDIEMKQGGSADASGPANFGVPGLFHGWGDAPVTDNMYLVAHDNTITANVSGQAVRWISGKSSAGAHYFPITYLKPGMRILIPGSAPACPQNLCAVTNVGDEKTLSIQQSLPNLGNVNGISFPNFGFKIWKKSNQGTVYLDSVNTDWKISTNTNVGNQGLDTFCSAATVKDPATGESGYTCIFPGEFSKHGFYWLNQKTGDARLLSPLGILNVSAGSTPLEVYVRNSNQNDNYGEGDTFKRCVYQLADSKNGGLKTYYPKADNDYNPALYSKAACTDVGINVAGIVAQAHPEIDQDYFRYGNINSISFPYLDYRMFSLGSSESRLAWWCVIDMRKKGPESVVNCHNNFSTYPERWNSSHGDEFFFRAGMVEMNAQNAHSGYQIPIAKIYGNDSAGTTLTDKFVKDCGSLGVTDQQWIKQGAQGNHCIQINILHEPLRPLGNGAPEFQVKRGDKAAVIHRVNAAKFLGTRPVAFEHNSAACGGDGTTNLCADYLQALAEGDYINSCSGPNCEKFLVAKHKILPDGTIDLVLVRAMNPFNCSNTGMQAHANGWSAVTWNVATCGAGGTYYLDITKPNAIPLQDNPNVFLSHALQFSRGTTMLNLGGQWGGASKYEWGGPYEGYGIRLGSFPDIVGKDFQFGVNGLYPFAGDGSGVGNTIIQTHPGGLTWAAPSHCENPSVSCDETKWVVDGRPFGGALGGALPFLSQMAYPVSGLNSVVRVSIPWWTCPGAPSYPQNLHGCQLFGAYQDLNHWDPSFTSNATPASDNQHWAAYFHRKTRAVAAFAGYHLLLDISGPGSRIKDVDEWTYCFADLPDECVPGAKQNEIYANIPAASRGGICTGDLAINSPCVFTGGPEAASFMQFAVDKPDPFGLRSRNLGMAFGGWGRDGNYANMHSLATADWFPVKVNWADGQRSDIFVVKNPGWPAEDAEFRNTFVKVSVKVPPTAEARIRFGYNEKLFCSSRQEACTTAAAPQEPYTWASEAQKWTPCAEGCTIEVPAVAQRVVFYVIDHKDGSGKIVTGAKQITTVN